MVTIPIHQDTSSVPLMTSPVIDLTVSRPASITIQAPLQTSTTTTTVKTTATSLPPPPLHPQHKTTDLIIINRIGELGQLIADLIHIIDEVVTDAVDWAMQAPLRARFSELLAVDMKLMSLEHDHLDQLALDLEEARLKKRKKHAAPRTPFGSPSLQPPPPPPLAGGSGAPGTSGSSQQQGGQALSSSKFADTTQQSMAWTTTDTQYESIGITGAQELSLTDSLMQDDSFPDEQLKLLLAEDRPATPEPTWIIPSFNASDVENNWAAALASTYEPPAENTLLEKTGDMTTFMDWYCYQVNKTSLTQANLEGQAYEVVDWTNPEGNQVRINVNRPLPLGGPPGHLTIQTQFFFNKDLDYLRYINKGSCPALSISKIKAARYPNFGLELLVPEQIWIEEVHDAPSHKKEVKSNMQILSVIRIKAYSRYDYDYLSEIVLRRANYQEHTIAEKDFKNLYPSDFEDLNILLLQGHLDHLPGSNKCMLSTTVKLWTRYKFKHDYTIIESPHVVVFPVNSKERKIMRFNEIYKFSDGTLTYSEGRDKEQRVHGGYLKAIEDEADLSEFRVLCVVTKLGSIALACKVIVILDKFKLTMRETLLRCFTKGYAESNL
ncbi:hypothetical protein Tco_0419027 [Tanacetum coccineum]